MSDDAAQALVTALQATVAALEGGDIEAAAAGAAALDEACAAAAATGTRFDPAMLDEARALQARCEALALEIQAGVVAAVLQSSTERKATHAYGSGK